MPVSMVEMAIAGVVAGHFLDGVITVITSRNITATVITITTETAATVITMIATRPRDTTDHPVLQMAAPMAPVPGRVLDRVPVRQVVERASVASQPADSLVWFSRNILIAEVEK